MRPSVSFRVSAVPVPKGSLKAFTPKGWTRPVLTSTSRGLKDWASCIRAEAQRHVSSCAEGAVSVSLDFRLPRIKALPKTKPAPAHTKKPDVDKLARAVLDALTGVAWRDDAQVTRLACTKRYASLEEPAGVIVQVHPSGV